MPIILELSRQRQEDCRIFETNLVYIVSQTSQSYIVGDPISREREKEEEGWYKKAEGKMQWFHRKVMDDKRRNEKHQKPRRANQKHFSIDTSAIGVTQRGFYSRSVAGQQQWMKQFGGGGVYFIYTSRLRSMTEETRAETQAGTPRQACVLLHAALSLTREFA